MNVSDMRVHPVADIFPPMSVDEFDALKADIAEHGQREPIWVKDGAIIDGRHRFRACDDLGLQCAAREYDGNDIVEFVVSLNLRRRHLDESQRAMVAAALATMRQGARTDLSPTGEMSQEAAAALLSVGKRSVERAVFVTEQGAPELVSAVQSGAVSVSAAADVAQLPHDEQRELVARGEHEILQAAKVIREQRVTDSRVKRDEEKRAAAALPVPEGKNRVIVIDPPWEMEKIVRDNRPNAVNFGFDYPTMTGEELAAFAVAGMAHDDCHLFCWTTQKHLPTALQVVGTWGFRYVLLMVWHKTGGFQPYGLPQYNAEFIVYARRGAPEFTDTTDFFACFDGKRREHSRKPDEFYDTIRRVTLGPRIDVFSRESREGFQQFGNDTERFVA